jgi:hypothetical protein
MIPVALLGLVLVASACTRTETIRNDRVAVFQERLGPGQVLSVAGDRPSVSVYLDAGELETESRGGAPRKEPVRRGQASFQPPGARTLKNLGQAEVRWVRVDLLGTGSQEDWGRRGLPPGYQLLFENPHVRSYDIQMVHGGSEPLHTHQDRVVICLNGAELVHRMPDGKTESSTLKTGEIAWRKGGTHVGQNVGSSDLWAIAVEPK